MTRPPPGGLNFSEDGDSFTSWKLSDVPNPTPVFSDQLSTGPSKSLSAHSGASNHFQSLVEYLEPYLDAESILLLRSTSHFFHEHKYKLGGPAGGRVLRFSSFRGYDGQQIVEGLLPQCLNCVAPCVRAEGVEIDLTGCVGIKDSQLAYLVSSSPFFVPSPQPEKRLVFTKLTSLRLDFCPHITERGVAALLSSHLPHLGRLSLKCVRSEALCGDAICSGLHTVLWPRFRQLNADFTSFSLEALTEVARFVTDQAAQAVCLKPAEAVNPRPSNPPAAVNESGDHRSPVSEGVKPVTPALPLSPHISFIGSWASKTYLELIGAKHLVKGLAQALNSNDPTSVYLIATKAKQEVDSLLRPRLSQDPLAPFAIGRGHELLVNVPVTCPTSEEGGVNVWTLPISVAVLNGNVSTVQALFESGAVLDVVDHLGKSPLVRAVSSGNLEMIHFLLKSCRVTVTPHIVSGPSSLNVAIEKREPQITKLLLESGFPLNLKCPAFKNWKSPLHAACELGDEATIHSLLDWGANPNSFSGTYRNSPAMIAYRANPRFLPVFLQGGPWGPVNSLPLAGEILSAAIAKSDVKSIELLIALFPALISRPHATWSYPHIQATKTGKVELLDSLLSSHRMHPPGSSVAPIITNDTRTLRERLYSHLLRETATYRLRAHGRNPCPLHIDGSKCAHQKRRRPVVVADAVAARSKQGESSKKAAVGMARQSSPCVSKRHEITSASPLSSKDATKAQPPPTAEPMANSNPARLPSLEIDQVVERAAGVTVSASAQPILNSCLPSGRQKSGAPPASESLDADGYHPHDSAEVGITEILSLKESQTGNTALHYAAEDGNLECVRAILAYGADINAVNNQGQTPLHLACIENHQETAQFFVRQGCKLLVKDREQGERPLTTCIRLRNDALAMLIFRELMSREALGIIEAESPEPSAVDNETAHAHLDNSKPPRSAKCSALFYAIFYGRYAVARCLMKHPAQVQELLQDEELTKSTLAVAVERLTSSETGDSRSRVLRKLVRLVEQRSSPKIETAASTPSSSMRILEAPPSPPSGASSSSGERVELGAPAPAMSTSAKSGSKNWQLLNDMDAEDDDVCSICSGCDHCSGTYGQVSSNNRLLLRQLESNSSSAEGLGQDQDRAPGGAGCGGDESQSMDRTSKTRQRARRLHNKLRSAAKKPFHLFHRVKSGDAAAA